MKAQIASNEAGRLQALNRYEILDTAPESGYDDLASLASTACSTPMALISLVDRERQWFKARVGLTAAQTPRDIAFCAHAILQRDVFIIPDAKSDERFSSNPLVISDPHIRFYAGAPLITPDGYALGTVCVLDRVPRQLLPEQAQILRVLSRQVVSQLERRRTLAELTQTIAASKEREEALRSTEEFKNRIIETSRDCIKVLDMDGRLLSMNAGGMEILEICDFTPFRNARWFDFWKGSDREAAQAAVAAASSGGVGRFVGYCPTANGKPMWWDVVVSGLPDPEGKTERLLAVSRDVTEQQRSEELLREITEGTASHTGVDFFPSFVRHLAAALRVRYAFVTECVDNSGSRLKSLAFWKGESFGNNFEYDVSGTPCSKVMKGSTCLYSDDVQKLFPDDQDLVELGAVSYLGVPMLDQTGRVIGHVVVMDTKPMDRDTKNAWTLETFAARAAAELQRVRAQRQLEQALADVEALKNRLHAENVYLQEEIRNEHNFEEIVGNSPSLRNVLAQVMQVASTDATVLIYGETGTGKELIARAIHDRSTRQGRALVKVNCGAISAGLVESELFGHVKGAFTGAIQRRTGRFELANGGTLFLDEVSELPLETQVKLLRVLQEGEFEPVGSSQTVRVNVLIIAASNADLASAVAAGRFRSDLFYRLNVFPLRVPPLRERGSDVRELAMFFVTGFAKKFGKRIESVSEETLDGLCGYSWPGNIRELQNIIERAVILCPGPVLRLDQDLLPVVKTTETAKVRTVATTPSSTSGSQPALSDVPRNVAPPVTLDEAERRHILAVLERANGVIHGPNGAAKILNIHPNTLRSRMKKLGIHRRSYEMA